jgi:transcriptional regulator with XRE-family HTH domain
MCSESKTAPGSIREYNIDISIRQGLPFRRAEMDTVGERLRHVRQQRGLTLEELATKAGLSKSFLWAVEQDRSGISGGRLLQVANALGASLDFLLRGEPAPEDYKPPVVQIPRELSDAAEERSLSYRQTIALLEIHKSILARRSTKSHHAMTKQDWIQLLDGVSDFLEGEK